VLSGGNRIKIIRAIMETMKKGAVLKIDNNLIDCYGNMPPLA